MGTIAVDDQRVIAVAHVDGMTTIAIDSEIIVAVATGAIDVAVAIDGQRRRYLRPP